MEQSSIGDMLNDTTPETVTEVEQPAPVEAQPETAERPRGPDGKFISKETGVETPPAPEAAEPVPPTEQTDRLPQDVYEPLKAVRDENKELKRRLEQMERNLRQPPPQQQPQQPPVDFWDDPHGYMSQQFNQFGQTLLQQFEQRQVAQRIDRSEADARSKYADYDEAFSAFEQAVQANPRLAYELAQADNPGEFAYSKGKTALTLNSVGSMEELEAQLRRKWEAEVKAAVPTPMPTLPSTTATDGSVGARTGPDWSGPTPLGKMLG